jgi:hypothetical protein
VSQSRSFSFLFFSGFQLQLLTSRHHKEQPFTTLVAPRASRQLTMSIAKFYRDNGIDITDPDSYDDWIDRVRPRAANETVVHKRYPKPIQQDDSFSWSAASSWPLNESELDYMGETRGWTKIKASMYCDAPMASYRRDDIRLEFSLYEGTVASYLDYPSKTQLFCRELEMSQASALFVNPNSDASVRKHHQDIKPQVQQQQRNAKPCRYGDTCRRPDCWFSHSIPPSNQTGGGGLGECRFGSNCNRAGCWYDHTSGR